VRRFFSRPEWLKDEDLAAGGPFYLFLFVMLVATYVAVLVTDESMRQAGRLALFSALMLVHTLLHLSSALLPHRQRWIPAYCLIQGGLVLAIGFLTQAGALILGLNMALIGEMVGVLWPNRRAAAAVALFFMALLSLNVVVLWGGAALLQFLPGAAAVLIFVLLYVSLYVRQVQAREDAQALLQELEVAHGQLQAYASQVEELTISQERQRMARELHDTLAQGLAGLILQLEAAEAHLETGNQNRAQAVVGQAMQRARTTLGEARRAIQALRPAALEQGNLVDALGQEMDRFAATTGVDATFEADAGPPALDPDTALDILRIVQEALSNVARHAGASHVLVRLAREDGTLRLEVHDDGIGFEVAGQMDPSGTFGLRGMQERAQRIGGHLAVESSQGQGTRLRLVVGEGGP
jgi:NarL family two-component system sensor histidine kinase YdfH